LLCFLALETVAVNVLEDLSLESNARCQLVLFFNTFSDIHRPPRGGCTVSLPSPGMMAVSESESGLWAISLRSFVCYQKCGSSILCARRRIHSQVCMLSWILLGRVPSALCHEIMPTNLHTYSVRSLGFSLWAPTYSKKHWWDCLGHHDGRSLDHGRGAGTQPARHVPG